MILYHKATCTHTLVCYQLLLNGKCVSVCTLHNVSCHTQTKAIRIIQHIYLMYANGLGEINEGTINHHNDALKKTQPETVHMR